MRIAFDGHWWTGGPPSGRNVLRSLVENWTRSFPNDQIVLIGRALEVPEGIEVRFPRIKQHAISNILEFDALTRDCDGAILQNFSSIRLKIPAVTFVHDIIYLRHPEWFTKSERLYLSLIKFSARFANRVATSSEWEASQIRAEFGNLDDVIPVGLALPEDFRSSRSCKPNVEVGTDSFYLCVGRLNVRKNLRFVVESLCRSGLISEQFPLVVVGEPDGSSSFEEMGQDFYINGRVIFTGFLPDKELKWLYENCRLFIFASLDEGFGLPLLEAEHSCAPMVISDIPAFKEIANPGLATFFNPYSKESLVSAIHSAGQRTYAADESDRYSWTETVHKIRECLQ